MKKLKDTESAQLWKIPQVPSSGLTQQWASAAFQRPTDSLVKCKNFESKKQSLSHFSNVDE